MALRRPAAGAAPLQQQYGTLYISSLPPDLLLLAFRRVPLAERHSALALVCRQWAELVHSPALLDSLDMPIEIDSGRPLPRMRLLADWLVRRAAGHVRRLHVEIKTFVENDDENSYLAAAGQRREAAAALIAALPQLAGGLRELSLDTSHLPLPPLTATWLAPLAGLTSLALISDSGILGPVETLRCLTALQRLRLDGNVSMPAKLPPAVTSFWLRSMAAYMPGQEAAPSELGSLQELTLVALWDRTNNHAFLARLHSSLTALSLTLVAKAPACLAQLSQLRVLASDDIGGWLKEADKQILEQALPRLQHLTAVHILSPSLPGSLAAISSLQHLDTVCWQDATAAAAPLPGGPWLAHLRRLALSSYFLSDAASLATLSGASQLERLGVRDTYKVLQPQGRRGRQEPVPLTAEVQRITAWAERHPSLQLLALERVPLDALHVGKSPRPKRAAQLRPGLLLHEVEDVFLAACGLVRQDPF
ncbi:tubby-like F-box 3 isoform X2 [Chlorella sorokiniana]|uniref:Tubby-like F-box 3 isoform X2 n=1 Tax=Chlorella sorokiniana TaxID=3076 RepID=A0A2P6TH49_CHLSO|nr:tubby-like F-box 3 isoform X2 [Chlorella sorokiniana]|eukprot:PRW33618.1 tubby-like F-box 3 isoform X2 [Chlorella sorokiniana]